MHLLVLLSSVLMNTEKAEHEQEQEHEHGRERQPKGSHAPPSSACPFA